MTQSVPKGRRRKLDSPRFGPAARQNENQEATMNAINTQEYRRFRRLRISMLFGPLFSACLAMTETSFSEVPRGVFCLLPSGEAVSYTHLRAHETPEHLVC